MTDNPDILDRAARDAFRRHCVALGGRDGAVGRQIVAQGHRLSARTVERLYAGREPIPAGLAAEIADALDFDLRASPEAKARGATLQEWADHCRNQQEGHAHG